MATLVIPQLGGLDKKSNHLSRQSDKASDMLNMEYDTQTTLKKRNGIDDIEAITSDDMVYYPTADEKLFFTYGTSSVYIKGNGYTKTMPLPYTIGSDTDTSISSDENTLSLYFTKEDYSIPVIKYDGSSFYRAGLPTPRQTNDAKPSMTNTAGGTTRLFYSYKDINGLTVFSPYYEIETALSASSTLSVNSLKEDTTCSENGFFNKYCWVAPSFNFIVDASSASTAYPQMSSDISRKMIVKRHNYIVGEKFLFDAENPMLSIYSLSSFPATRSFLALEIEAVENDTTNAVFTGSISGTTLTVTAVTSGTILLDGIISGGAIAANTYIKSQLSGTTGGTGTYQLSVSQTVSSLTITEKISSITFKQITSDYNVEIGPVSLLGTFWPSNPSKIEYPLDTRTKLHVFDNVATGTTFTQTYIFVLDNSSTLNAKTIGASPTTDFFRATIPTVSFEYVYMEDVYNTSSSKIMPPICKYIATYGDQIIYGSVQSYIGFDNKRIQYNNNDLIHNWEKALGKLKEAAPMRPIANDGPEAEGLFKMLMEQAPRLLKEEGCCCCCGGGPDPQFARWSLWMDEVFQFKQMVVWDKGPMGMGWHYRRPYETVLVAQKQGAPCQWYDTSRQVENIVRHIRKIIPRKDQHPTEKPVALAAHFIALHTQPGDLLLDPFCGAGSTLIAAKKMGRNYIGIELDPKWYAHATTRLEQETENLFANPNHHKPLS